MNEIDRLFSALWRNTIGFDQLFEFASRPVISFPRYDIVQNGPDHYVLQLALAGYKPSDVEVFKERNVLHVNSTVEAPKPDASMRELTDTNAPRYVHAESDIGVYKRLHAGIAKRQFKLSFALPEHVEVQKAEFDNGLLSVELARIVPEALQPKRIPVTVAGMLPSPTDVTNSS